MPIKRALDFGRSATYINYMDWTQEIDAIGLLCPLPVLRTRKRMMPWDSGTIVRISTTDPAALVDMPHFCNEAGHSYLGSEEDGDVTYHFVQKG